MALFTDQINNVLKEDTIAKHTFAGVYPADMLPFELTPPLGIVANLDDAKDPGSHWVGIYIRENGEGMYFDSYGLPPLRPQLNAFLNKYKWKYNTKRFQTLTSEDCGWYAILFILLASRGYDLKEIQFIFYNEMGRLNDILVKGYIKEISKGNSAINWVG